MSPEQLTETNMNSPRRLVGIADCGFRISNFVLALRATSLIVILGFSAHLTAQTGPKSLSAITSQAQFDSISVTYDANTPYALPHTLFVIDRKDGDKIYYVSIARTRSRVF